MSRQQQKKVIWITENRKFLKPASDSYKTTVEAIAKLANEESLDNAQRAYAEALTQLLVNAYGQEEGLTLEGGSYCIHTLNGKKCGGTYWPVRPCECRPPATDHSSLWLKNGKPFVYISQPYNLTLEVMAEIVKFCETHGFTVKITSHLGWHFPGRVLVLEYRVKE